MSEDDSTKDSSSHEVEVGHVGANRSPRSFEIRLRTLGIVLGVVVVAIAIGAGAFLYGRSTGENLDAARAAGAEAGRAKGAARGAARGYAVGFKKGRERGFDQTFSPAFKESYAKAFDEAELDAPPANQIAVPEN